MGTLLQDIRYGLRMLAKNPGFTLVAVLTLALGIGANTAIFSALDAVILKSLPVYKPDELVLFADTAGQGYSRTNTPPAGRLDYLSYPLYTYFRDHNQAFRDICAFRNALDDLTVQAEGSGASTGIQLASGQEVSGNYFAVLGVKVILGRTLTPVDDQERARPAAVISYRYWSKKFNNDASVVGRVVDLNGVPFTIVGVTPPEFFGVRVESNPADFWLPVAFQAKLLRRESWLKDPNTYWLDLMGRLEPGVSNQQAQAAVNVQLHQFFSAQAGSHISSEIRRDIEKSNIQLSPGGRGLSTLRLFYSKPLHLLMALVLIVLLIACANVAGLLLSRAAAREKEISVRLAVGATRKRLVRQLLTESLLLAGMGGAVGALFAAWSVNILKALVARNTPLDVSPDLKVLLFAIGVSVLSGAVFGLAPAFGATHVDLTQALKGRASTAGARRPRRFGLAKGLVAFQMACALPLIAGAGLFVRTLQMLERQDLGLSPEHVLVVGIDPRLAGYEPDQLSALYRQILDRVTALPGVRSASLSTYSPLSGSEWGQDITVQGYTPRSGQNMIVAMDGVAPRYFETEGIPVLLGRPIAAQDTKASPAVAVVNEAFARDFFSEQNPIGRRFGWGGNPERSGDIEIVGVVKDAKFFSLRDKPPRMFFVSLFQDVGDLAYANDLEVRAAGDPKSVASEVRKVFEDVDKNLPVTDIKTLPEQIRDSLNQERILSELSSFFGLLALLLACLGLYGLMSYSVVRRTNEIGVRIALGARRGDVLRLVVGQSVVLTGIGIGFGLAGALGLARFLTSLLYGVRATDPLTLVAASVLLASVGLLASYIPARRATKVDPMVALRYE